MNSDRDIAGHYSNERLLELLFTSLIEDGADPENLTLCDLAPYDQFHGRGMDATKEVADALNCQPNERVLDIGCGIGGPARYFAHRFGCHVTGIDLTRSFVDTARELNVRTGMVDTVTVEQCNALSMPFKDGSFHAAYSMNVSMNIADKIGFYAEAYRVLIPGGTLVLSELSKGEVGEVMYPTPWARTSSESFLATLEETKNGLAETGFDLVDVRDTAEESIAYGIRAKAMVDRGEKPPHRAVQLIHGSIAMAAMRNTATAVRERAAVPIEIVCKKLT